MSDPVFKYTDASQRAVSRQWPDGRFESHLVGAEVVQRWIAQGNTLLPADPAAQADNLAGVKEQRARALDALAATDPAVAKFVEVLKTAALI